MGVQENFLINFAPPQGVLAQYCARNYGDLQILKGAVLKHTAALKSRFFCMRRRDGE